MSCFDHFMLKLHCYNTLIESEDDTISNIQHSSLMLQLYMGLC